MTFNYISISRFSSIFEAHSRYLAAEMEYIEQESSDTFYPYQNKDQIYQHLQIVKMLCPFSK